MADDLVLYTNPMSRGRIVRWMLEEVAQPYRTQVLTYGPEMKAAAFRAVNPMGKVPALQHGDTIVTETAAICAYLADIFPEAGLAPPPGDRRRGPYYRWLFFAAAPLEAAITNASLGLEVPPDRARSVGYGCVADVLATLEAALLQHDYLDGHGFTAADLVLGAQIGYGLAFGTIEERPAFARYWSRLAARPAYLRARDQDDALLSPEQRQASRL